MWVNRIIGDCPSCGGKACYGNVFVRSQYVLRGCKHCSHKSRIALPALTKKIIYLDQFFFSNVFKGQDPRFLEAAERIKQLSASQLIVAPFSSLHEDETIQWNGYGGRNKDDLIEFIKNASRGHEFEPAYQVERTQILKAFNSFLTGKKDAYQVELRDCIRRDIHTWDDYVWIDVNGYTKDADLLRSLKEEAAEALVNVLDDWRKSTAKFDEDLALEYSDAGKHYISSYAQFSRRIMEGDHSAILDAPIDSTVVQSMLTCFQDEFAVVDQLGQIVQFFKSSHFLNIPYQLISARMFAVLKDKVKRGGAYQNREKATRSLRGFFYDVKHIATYAPYCDVFIMDQPMAALVADPRIAIAARYGVKVISLNNWDELFQWFDRLEQGVNAEHKAGLEAAYPISL